MNAPIGRRKFTLSSAAFAAGLMVNSSGGIHAEERSLTDKRLVLLGLNALARSAEMNYFADGHRGAAMISAHLMCVDNNFDDAAAGRIVELFNLNWAQTRLCESFPVGDPVADATERVGNRVTNRK